VRLRREWLEVLVFVWCPRSGGHKRADLFQMCGLGMSFEKGASSRLEGLEPCPAQQSLGGRVNAPVLLADTVRDRSVVSRQVSLCTFASACRCRATP
jgi:hypothetical protein